MDGGRRVNGASKSSHKVQVVYYVSKNGELEHPHVVEVTHLLHHHLRLKDVLERLSVLRGRGMLSLYSWSCKRMYKNGYVWHDLGENDVILPSQGHEYVLKASQLVFHSPSPPPVLLDKHLHVEEAQQMDAPKCKPKRHTEEELEFEEKRINYASRDIRISTTSPSLSTEGDPYPTITRNSLLLHFMACGGGFKGKPDHEPPRKSCSSLHCKKAVAVEDEICCMSENPRFGQMQAEEREYFSGSIVETMRVQVEPMLNKSSSYTEQRGSKTTLSMAEEEEEEMKREKTVAGKCIPKRFC